VTLRPVTDSLDADSCARLRAAGATVEVIGRSAEGRPLHGVRIGERDRPLVSIVAGAHPDEPAGPAAALELLHGWAEHPLRQRVQLAVVPILDVDGAHAQRAWLDPWSGAIEPARYLAHRIRRPPGEDREFAWPGAPWPGCVLPECAAAAAFLDTAGPAVAHLSLHGMFVAHGPWFLLDREALRHPQLWRACREIAADLELPLHDDARWGDKGFRRVTTGFSTTPAGPLMRRFFLRQGDRETAAGFGYGSMDSARARACRHAAPPPLCAVSEFPLLHLHHLPTASEYRARREELQAFAAREDYAGAARHLSQLGSTPVPLADQVRGMLAMVDAVTEAALAERVPGRA